MIRHVPYQKFLNATSLEINPVFGMNRVKFIEKQFAVVDFLCYFCFDSRSLENKILFCT